MWTLSRRKKKQSVQKHFIETKRIAYLLFRNYTMIHTEFEMNLKKIIISTFSYGFVVGNFAVVDNFVVVDSFVDFGSFVVDRLDIDSEYFHECVAFRLHQRFRSS